MKMFSIFLSILIIGLFLIWVAYRAYISYQYEAEVDRLSDTVNRVVAMHNECNHTAQYLDSVINSMVEEGCKK